MKSSAKRLKNYALILLGVSVSFVDCQSALADKPEITKVDEGQPAPFTGDLYPVEDSIRMGMALDDSDERCAAAAEHQEKLQRIEIEAVKKIAATTAMADRERLAVLERQLEEAEAWYRDPAFVATMTAVTTVAAMLVATVLIQSTAEVGR